MNVRLEEWTSKMRQAAPLVEDWMAVLESLIVAVPGRLVMLAAPLISVVLVGRVLDQATDLPGAWPMITGTAIELAGLATTNVWLTARRWNAGWRKSDPVANERLALGLVIFHFGSTFFFLLLIGLSSLFQAGQIDGLIAFAFHELSAISFIALSQRAIARRTL